MIIFWCSEKARACGKALEKHATSPPETLHKGEIPMTSLPHPVPSRMTHNVAALFGHTNETLVAWQQACVHAADGSCTSIMRVIPSRENRLLPISVREFRFALAYSHP